MDRPLDEAIQASDDEAEIRGVRSWPPRVAIVLFLVVFLVILYGVRDFLEPLPTYVVLGLAGVTAIVIAGYQPKVSPQFGTARERRAGLTPPQNTSASLAVRSKNALYLLVEFLARLAVGISAILSLLVIVLFLLEAEISHNRHVALAALAGAIFWGLGYRLLSPPTSGQLVSLTNRTPTPNTLPRNDMPLPQSGDAQAEARDRSLMARYGAGIVALTLGTLGFMVILGNYGHLLDFVVVFPALAFFPFSYLAYVSFQRAIRVKRLQIDFDLLGIPWDGELFEKSQSFWRFILHIILAMAVTILGLFILRLDQGGFKTLMGRPVEVNRFGDILQALQFGFLGSYLFAVQLIYRRYVTFDLHPTVYLFAAVTMLAGLIFNFAAFGALTAIVGSHDGSGLNVGDGLMAILAFGLGYFPFVPMQWFSRVVTNALNVNQRRSEGLALDLIDGISQLHQARLSDHGVDNVQNLAAVDLPSLLINSTFSAQQVIEWVDQALLYLYLDQSEISSFSKARIRTISDFRHIWKPLYKPAKDKGTKLSAEMDAALKDKREKTALQFSLSEPQKLDLLYEATDEGPNLHYVVHYWKNADFRRKIDYLFNFSCRESPKFSYTLEQAFLNFVAFPTTEKEIKAEELWKYLEDIWNEIDAFPIDEDKKLTSYNDLAWAGLGYLKERFASKDNLPMRLASLEQSVQCYQQAELASEKADEQIQSQIQTLPEREIAFVKTACDTAEMSLEANKTKSARDQETSVKEVSLCLASLGAYLNDVLALIDTAYEKPDNRPAVAQLIRICQAFATSQIDENNIDFARVKMFLEGIRPLLNNEVTGQAGG